ncbi:MAG: hypothetical protein MJA28_05865 [Gammaproteobacteria bacterium]|nr:hypothetical protein [Gammaproteobacteria bacterium]MCP4234508.1 hypothetical protein [Aestuariibacter sp.]MCP5017431.1 hypothetical protein [Ketobacter sp.]
MALKAKTSSRANEAKAEALKEVSKEKTMRFNANIPESLYLKVKVKAAQENVKLNDLAIQWMEDWVNE